MDYKIEKIEEKYYREIDKVKLATRLTSALEANAARSDAIAARRVIIQKELDDLNAL